MVPSVKDTKLVLPKQMNPNTYPTISNLGISFNYMKKANTMTIVVEILIDKLVVQLSFMNLKHVHSVEKLERLFLYCHLTLSLDQPLKDQCTERRSKRNMDVKLPFLL